jgi:hypothetical protein
MNPYKYNWHEIKTKITLEKTTRKWLRYAVEFPSAYPTEHPENNTVIGEYYQPRKSNHAPLAILVHGWGDHSVIPCKLLLGTLLKRGFACFILYLVFHSKRMAAEIKQRVPYLTPEEWYEGYRVSVINIRQVIDWASTRPEIDPERIGVVGISLGGFVSTIAMGVEPRIKAGVFTIAGGNAEKLTWKTENDAIRKGHSCTEEECQHVRSLYPQYRADVVEKGLENVVPAKECFLTDPLTYAPFVKDRPVMMINARWDQAVPREATLDLWEALDRPPISWLPARHASIWLLYPIIGRKIANFLTQSLNFQPHP